MAKKDIPGLKFQKVYTGPDGNLARHLVRYEEKADLAAADIVYVAPLPQGAVIHKIEAVVHEVAAADETFSLGTEQKGAGNWVDDDDYFLAAQAADEKAAFDSLSVTKHRPLTVDEPNVYLTVKADTAITVNWGVDLYITYEFVGNL